MYATMDNGSCVFDTSSQVYGCMDTLALNYDMYATMEDGSCIFDTSSQVYGCTDTLALNYDMYATMEDGSCIFDTSSQVYGCTDTLALNYDMYATMDNGTCSYGVSGVVVGCLDMYATNYTNLATIDNGTCVYTQAHLDTAASTINGCTDVQALNYSATAAIENGSCIYTQDTVFTKIDLAQGEVITATVVAALASECGIDYDQLIDSAYVYTYALQGNVITLTWSVWQRGQEFKVNSTLDVTGKNITPNDIFLVYAPMSCVSATKGALQRGTGSTTVRGLLRVSTITSLSYNEFTNARVYPLPASDYIMVNVANKAGVITICDGLGVEVISQSVSTGVETQKVDLEALKNGFYVLSFKSNTGVELKEVIIKK